MWLYAYFMRITLQINDRIRKRLPIHCKLLELLLFETEREFGSQPYLQSLYKTIFSFGYYGLFRIGGLVCMDGNHKQHTILARNVHVAMNKNKILVILYSSKTHDKDKPPQKVKITEQKEAKFNSKIKFSAPFLLQKSI